MNKYLVDVEIKDSVNYSITEVNALKDCSRVIPFLDTNGKEYMLGFKFHNGTPSRSNIIKLGEFICTNDLGASEVTVIDKKSKDALFDMGSFVNTSADKNDAEVREALLSSGLISERKSKRYNKR